MVKTLWLTSDVGITSGSPEAGAQAAWFGFGQAVIVQAAKVLNARASENADVGMGTALDADDVGTSGNIEEARQRLADSLNDASAFAVLVANAGLDLGAAEVLAVLAAAESDLHLHRLTTEMLRPGSGSRMTLGLLQELLGSDHVGTRAVAPNAPLMASALVEVTATGAWVDHTVALHPAGIWELCGSRAKDPDLPHDVTYFTAVEPAGFAPELDPMTGQPMVSTLALVNGPDRIRRWQSGALHTPARRFVCAQAPTTAPPAADAPAPASEAGWAALVRDATMTGRGIIVEVGDALPPIGRRWIERASHLVWVVSTASGPPTDELPNRPWVDVVASNDPPTDAEWISILGEQERTHSLTLDQLHRIGKDHAAVRGDLDMAVRRMASGRLEQVTTRIRPTRTWDDIVVSADRLALLQEVGSRYRHRNKVFGEWGFSPAPSRGLVAMFSGPSGTGKTLAAEIITNDLGLDLFKLDLSSVVSKYIGETEKNLEKVFDAASAGNLVLFFDEADSLFGKRSEVKDARDRYANIEVSYLLQRLETYDGLVIMATNFEKNIDGAFLRRIHVRVPFALPEQKEREAIWRHNLPATAPAGDVDVGWLAEQFELSGGAIRNAAVQAAFAAANAGTDITMHAAVSGVAHEFRKMGRLIKPADFGDFFSAVSD